MNSMVVAVLKSSYIAQREEVGSECIIVVKKMKSVALFFTLSNCISFISAGKSFKGSHQSPSLSSHVYIVLGGKNGAKSRLQGISKDNILHSNLGMNVFLASTLFLNF